METLSENRCFEGRQLRLKHRAESLDCEMTFSVFLPPAAQAGPVPVLYWLSGLTCTDENFVHKAGAQRSAAAHGIAIVCPDTSPRGEDVPDDPEGAWDFGLGAGFYVNARREPWSSHYRMYDYVTAELPTLVEQSFPLSPDRRAISGHSMGGHGALTVALSNPGRYRSVSAFSPIVAPSQCPWGEKALGLYIGDDREQWRAYDTCELIRAGATHLPTLVDQGEADNFLESQLKTDLLETVCADTGYSAVINRRPGYDHSYFFIASFIDSHMDFHAKHLTDAS